ERVLEHFGGHVLSLVTVAHTTGNERVHALEIPLVQLAEPARVLLRGLDERALVVCSGHPLYKRSEKAKSHAQACEPASENDAADLGTAEELQKFRWDGLLWRSSSPADYGARAIPSRSPSKCIQ